MADAEYPTREAARSSGQGSGAIRSFDEEQIERAVQQTRARFALTAVPEHSATRSEQTIDGLYTELAATLCKLAPDGRDREAAIDDLFRSRAFAIAALRLRGTPGGR